MKTNKAKIIIIGFVLCFFIASPVFSQKEFKDLQKTLDGFTDNMAKSLPFNATMGLNWAPSHIGQFLGIPPHFGVGLAFGYTTMEGDSLGKLLGQFGLNLPFDFGGFPLLGYTVEGRIGGFILPFDVGVKFGILPIKENTSVPDSIDLDYLVVGADLRYRILEDKLLIPGISFGIGYNFLRGGIGQSIGKSLEFQYDDVVSGTPTTLTLAKPKVGVSWETSTIDLKLQISKSLIIVTPYAGFGASVGFSKAGYSVTTKITSSDTADTNLAAAKQALGKLGIKGLSANGFESFDEFEEWSFRFFGGISFNLPLLRIDLTGLYNIADGNYGITLGTRIQI